MPPPDDPTRAQAAQDAQAAATVFEQHRARLLGLSYRLLGRMSDAEEVVQEAFLRWFGSDRAAVRQPEAFLVTMVTRLSLDRLRLARTRQEQYIGPWLPEPVATDQTAGDPVGPLDTLEQRELISLGTLVLLERLSGTERGVFVLREAFDLSYDEIAPILGLTSANCRQLHTRAQKRLQQRGRFAPSADEHRRLLTGFLTAAQQGDLAALQALLATDVISYSDGGGRVSAARKPVRGRDRVSRFWLGLARKFPEAFASARLTELNGQPGLLLCLDRGAYTIAIEGQQGQDDGARIGALYAVINPDKLGFLERQLGWRAPTAARN